MMETKGSAIETGDALRIDALSVAFGGVRVVDGLDLRIARGEFMALVGESGSGKTVSAMSVIRQLPRGAETWGRISVGGTDVLTLDEREMRRIRGAAIGTVFQNPLAALNPSHTVGRQIAEALRLHEDVGRADARTRALALMEEVGIPDPASRIDDHPHRFSGGQRQRVMIAIALACSPALLIADEPTTGLDPLVARQILALLARLRRSHRMGVLFVSHDLSIVREHADSVHVLYAGRTAERGTAPTFFAGPRHPYGAALLAAAPSLAASSDRTRALADIPGQMPLPGRLPPGCRFAPRCNRARPLCDAGEPPLVDTGTTHAACLYPLAPGESLPLAPSPAHAVATGAVTPDPVLTLENVGVRYATASRPSLAGFTLTLARGECLGIVGESGSGKSTLGRAILQMVPHDGRIALDGRDFATIAGRDRRAARRRIQVVFQDPRESLNPRMTIGECVTEPLRLEGMGARARRAAAGPLLARVGLPASLAARFPGSVSGGQAQRVAIARALAAKPDVIVLDEPTSSLDVSTQATLLNLLAAIGRDEGVAYVLISHDLAAVAFLADRIAVLKDGAIVELQDTAALIASPRNPYTAALVATAARGGSGRERT